MYQLPQIDKPIFMISSMMIGTLFIICLRLFYLQISWGDYYAHRGEKNFLRIEAIPSHRGTIYDCNGHLLATNRPITHLVWQGTGNTVFSPVQHTLLEHLSAIMGPSFTSHQAIAQAEKQYKQVVISRDLSFHQLSQITEQYSNNQNLIITTHFERYYPYGSYASHAVGYLSRETDTPSYGQMGLEKIYNDLLKGHQGSVMKTINSVGRNIAATERHQSLTGTSIYTTIDIEVQRIAERIYPDTFTGCMLIMDPEHGALRALVSRPAFNPNLFLKPISYETWSKLQHKKPFLNRVTNPYPLGSIFKLITITAALEHNLLDIDHTWQCTGSVTFAGRNYWCNRRTGHGTLTTVQAIAQSCNVPFFELAQRMDIDLLSSYAQRFGLGESTQFLFSDNAGVVPSREWKLKTKGEQWWPGETLSVAIGQSFLLATPLHVARMIAAIFTGYLVKPRIIAHEKVEYRPLSINPESIDFLQRSMRLVVTNGTGKQVSAIQDMDIYAKTSTAQVTDIAKRTERTEFLEHAWFVSYFRYKTHKPLILLVFVEHAGTSQVALHIAKQFLIAFKDYSQGI